MPRYEYVCSRCGRDFELNLSYQALDDGDPTCPHCGSDHVRQKLSSLNFAVRGKHALTKEEVGTAMGLVDKIGPLIGDCSKKDE